MDINVMTMHKIKLKVMKNRFRVHPDPAKKP